MSAKQSIHHNFVVRYGIPPGWREVRLREAVEIVGGGTPDSSDARLWDGDIPWLTPTELSSQHGRRATTSERKITSLGLESSNCRLLSAGTLVLTTRGTIGTLAIAGVPLTCNQSCEALVPREGVSSDYLYYLLSFLRPLLDRLGAGTTFTSITRRDIRDIHLALPDTTEQNAIANILIHVDEAIAAADIKVTAAQRVKTALMQQLFARGIPGRHTLFKKTKIGEIPEPWEVGRISKVVASAIYNGVSPQSRPEPPGTPILNVSCISDGLCDPSKVTYVDLDGPRSEDLLARRGDFYILRGNGNREFIGTGGLLIDSPPEHCVFSDLLIKISFDHTKVAEGFMPLLWQSHCFLRSLQSKAVSGSGLWKIGLREVRRHEFAQPPIDEQREIVEILRGCDEIIQACQFEARKTDRLKRSLLQNLLTGRVRVRV